MVSKPKIAIVDYDCGNLFSLKRSLREVGVDADVCVDPAEIKKADKIILPGVGAFGDGMENLRRKGIAEVILQCASGGKPILGICLGMQLLFQGSSEFGNHDGLGLIPGMVTRLSESDTPEGKIKVPHIGWSKINFSAGNKVAKCLFDGLEDGAYVYFLHSFAAKTDDSGHCAAFTDYGSNNFCSIALKESIIGMQFHPEISGSIGLILLKNFIERI